MHIRLKKTLAAMAAAVMAAVQCCSFVSSAETKLPFVIEGEDMEDASLWTAIYQTEIPGYSGEGFFYLTGDHASFDITVPDDGMYSLTVRGAQILDSGGRMQSVEVNGVEYSKTVPYADTWTDFDFGMIRLAKGTNTIKFISKYGYMAIDKVTVDEAVFPDLSKASDTPIDPDATPETKALMKFLKSVYGSHVLSGQQEIYGGGHGVDTTIRYDAAANKCVDSNGKEYSFSEEDIATADDGSKFVWKCFDEEGQQYNYNSQNRNYSYNDYDFEIKYIKELTGEEPAIRGFDFGSYCPCYAWDDGVAQRMIDWTTKKNGICTASWHINVPTSKADYTLGEPLAFEKTTYTEKTDFSPKNCMIEGTMEYDYFQLCMENLANELLKLQNAGVPVIFRPFHEAEGNPSHTDDPIDGSGSWFWWAKEGAVVYNQLWAFLQDTLMNEYGLHNLIYEQNLYAWSDSSAAWYSGDDKVDLVGYDKYNCKYNRHDGKQSGPNEDAEGGLFYSLNKWVDGKKMVAMPENDTVPSVKNIEVEHAYWLYFCPWYDSEQEHFLCGEDYQDPATLTEMYQSELCLTLSELPADLFKGGELPPPDTTTTIKPSDIVYGDANCDGSVDLADAVLIMQCLANPNRYGLKGDQESHITAQGWANADCTGGSNGVTNEDALAIQMMLLGLVTLPVE